MFSTFHDLCDLSADFNPEDDTPECGVFGNNINQPTDSGLDQFNKGVNFMTKFGDYSVPLTEAESQDNNFDTEQLNKIVPFIEKFFNETIKRVNDEENTKNNSYKRTDLDSAMGFMRGMDGDVSDDESEALELMKSANNDMKFNPESIKDVKFNSPQELATILTKAINSTSPLHKTDIKFPTSTDTAKVVSNMVSLVPINNDKDKLIKDSINFIKFHDITTLKGFIDKIKSEFKAHHYTKDTTPSFRTNF